MVRRDRHKVYAADLQQHEGDDGNVIFSPTATSQDNLPGRGSSDPPQMISKEGCSDEVAYAFREGGNVDAGAYYQSNDSGVNAMNTGGIGPGAEPPVAIAFHAFAHDEPCTDAACGGSKSTFEQGTETIPLNVSCSDRERMRGLSVERGDETRGDEKRLFGGKQDIAVWPPTSTRTSNEGEADTLPDSFYLSDEYGPEGASTGRNHHDDDDNDGSTNGRREPLSIGSPKEAGCGVIRGGTKPSSGRYFVENSNDRDAPSGFQRRQEEQSADMFGKSSDGSDHWSSSSERLHHQPRRLPQPRFSRRRARQNSRRAPLGTTKRYSRIAPSEDLASPDLTDVETEGGRRHRRTSCRGSVKRRSPPRRHPRGEEDSSWNRRSRRGVGGYRKRDLRREALTETESMCGEPNDELEEEVAKLRRENEELKRRQEGTTRLSDQGFDVEPWKNDEFIDGCFAKRDSSRRATRRRDDTFDIEGRSQRHSREGNVRVGQQELQHEHRRRSRSIARASHLSGVETSTGRSSTRRRQGVPTWTEFVSKSNSSPAAKGPMGSVGPHSWASRSSENANPSFDLSLPRVLVEGGYLWKIPCHNAGTPKRRWFQIKPADGLLTTASGHLVVRPTSAGGVGAGGSAVGRRKIDSAVSRRSEDGEESTGSVPMMRLRAAWPLALIWVDPERDLKKSPPREMGIEEVMDLARGHKTPAFWQQAAHRGIHTLPDPKLCFSLIGSERTLDLAAEGLLEAKEWVLALARVALMVDRGGLAAANGYAAVCSPRSQVEPATTPHSSDSEKLSSARLRDNHGGGDEISHVGLPRQPSKKSGKPLRKKKEFCTRSEENSAQEKVGVLGGGRASSVDTTRSWRQRIFPAVNRGDVASVLAMFDQGCPVDLVHEETGDTPMLLACRLGDMGMVTECLRRGARNDPHPNFGQTALQAAVAAGREACARLLLETAAPSRSDVVVSNHKDPNKDTPLHVACRRGYRGIVEALLHHGGDLRAANKKGNTPLHGAAGCGHAAVLASLLDAGGDAVLEEKNSRGERAMHTAAASGHIACVELLLGTAAEPDIPRTDGQTPFMLASRGGHLAVTRLIRRYAPAAGTPSGGDVHFQTHQRANTGRQSATADALPRPHASGPASTAVGIPSPSAHQDRDLDHRFYSAAGLEHSKEPPSSETALTYTGDERMGCARLRSAPNASAPLPHGSLFDGLQVYVVGGRQPLGSQHASTAAKAGIVSKPSPQAPTSARTMILEGRCLSASFQQQQQREHELEQRRHVDPPTQEASQMQSSSTYSLSTGVTLESNWRDNILSAPSTLAPSPPLRSFDSDGSTAKIPATIAAATTLDAGVNITQTPVSARALARMIHFSSESHAAFLTAGKISTGKVQSPRIDALTSTASVVGDLAGPAGSFTSASSTGGGGERGAQVQPLGPWMTPGIHDEQKRKASTRTRDFENERNNAVTENSSASYATAVNAAIPDGFGTSTITADGTSKSPGTGRDVNTSQEDERQAEVCFVIGTLEGRDDGRAGTAGSAALSGLWRVFQSEGYPYFLHEATGHSQWEDPRESRGVVLSRSSLLPAEASVPPDIEEYCSSERHPEHPEVDDKEISGEETTRVSAKITSEEERDGQQCLPPAEFPIKPILPRKVPVAVNVSHLFDVDDVSRSATIAARDLEGCRGTNPAAGKGSTTAPGCGDNADECDQAGVQATDFPEGPTSPVHTDDNVCDGTRRVSRRVDGVDSRDFARNAYCTNFEADAGSGGDSRPSDFNAVGAKTPAELDGRRDSKSCNNISDGSKAHGNGRQDLVDSGVPVDSHVSTTKEAVNGKNTNKIDEPEAKKRPDVEEYSDSSWSSLPADGTGSADGVRTVNVGSPRSRPELFESVLDGIGKNIRKNTGLQDEEGGHEEEEEWWQELDDETVGEASRESGLSSSRTEVTST